MGTFNELRAQFDPEDERRRGKQFEYVCQWFLTNDPTYRAVLRKVWLWKEWTGRWSDAEAGIDLVAEDTDGRLWAIQAKAYATARSVTKHDVDKFLTESSRPQFSYRILIATTDNMHHIAKRTMDDLGVSFIGLTELSAADDYLDWPQTPAHLRPSKPPERKRPWDYQRTAIDRVVKGLERADRGQLIMACGTGKTLTARFITQELAAERTLVLVPSLSLLKQTMREWRIADVKWPFRALPVCSDETVGRAEDDAAISHTSDLGVPVTTDPEVIADFLRNGAGRRVVFSTYQSSPQIASALALSRVPEFDLVIADEAHRCAGPAKTDFATVLDPLAIKAKRRLFMTATPRIYSSSSKKAAEDANFEYASMDDPAKFGDVFHRLKFSEAIERKLLTDYQIVIIGVDDATYQNWAERGTLVNLDGTKMDTDARSLAGQIGLAKAMAKYDLQRIITFHGRVNSAKKFAASMPAVLDWMPADQRPNGALWSKFASGTMSAGERHVLLQHLKRLDDGERGLLANARCLAEGVDVPALDGVAFIDPKRSEVEIVQAVGRAIRKSESKTIGTVVIPVFINTDDDPEIALRDSVFKPVWDVVKALRSHDDELGSQLDELRRELGRQRGRLRLPAKICDDDLVETVGANFARAFELRLVEQTTASWQAWYGLLEQFVGDAGHARVQASYIVDGYKLGAWVSDQRIHYGQGILVAERQRRLEELPGWSWDPHADNWEEGFTRLEQYVGQNGHARVPQSYKADGYRLGQWISVQRANYGKGVLGAERQRRLEELPGWAWDAKVAEWEEGFRRLVRYVEQNGHARLPASYKAADGYFLGRWVVYQRVNHDKGVLDADRQRRLEVLAGWTWDPKVDEWEDGFRRLVRYVEQNGHARVPPAYDFDGYKLSSFVTNQRGKYTKGVLDAKRQRRLEELPGWTWNPHADSWEEGFTRLEQYVGLNGHARVPQSYKTDSYKLGLWVTNQRGKYARGVLDAKRQRRLEDLPGWTWNTLSDGWEDGFARLLQYVEQNSHSRVPQSYKADGYLLGRWVHFQRRKYAKGVLDAERQRRLEELPGWTWVPVVEEWEEGCKRLTLYVEQNGHARVPLSHVLDGYKLGRWVAKKRSQYANGVLDAERQRRLEELPGWTWNPHANNWEEGFTRLEQYVGLNGHARVPQSYKTDSYKLGLWVTRQRGQHTKGLLDAERQRRLEEVPGWTWNTAAVPGE